MKAERAEVHGRWAVGDYVGGRASVGARAEQARRSAGLRPWRACGRVGERSLALASLLAGKLHVRALLVVHLHSSGISSEFVVIILSMSRRIFHNFQFHPDSITGTFQILSVTRPVDKTLAR